MATVGGFVIPPLESEPTNPLATALNRCRNECESMISIKYDGRIGRRGNKMSMRVGYGKNMIDMMDATTHLFFRLDW